MRRSSQLAEGVTHHATHWGREVPGSRPRRQTALGSGRRVEPGKGVSIHPTTNHRALWRGSPPAALLPISFARLSAARRVPLNAPGRNTSTHGAADNAPCPGTSRGAERTAPPARCACSSSTARCPWPPAGVSARTRRAGSSPPTTAPRTRTRALPSESLLDFKDPSPLNLSCE